MKIIKIFVLLNSSWVSIFFRATQTFHSRKSLIFILSKYIKKRTVPKNDENQSYLAKTDTQQLLVNNQIRKFESVILFDQQISSQH